MDFLNKRIDKENVMLCNMMYNRGTKDTDYVDTMDIIYKDLKTGEKYLQTIDKPEMDIYFTKEEFRDYDYNKTHMELEKLDVIRCKVKDRPWAIAKAAGEQHVNFIKNCIELKRYKEIDKIHTYPYVFGSDVDPEAFYRINWLQNYDNEKPKPLSKQYLDIEVDSIDINGMPANGNCPINAVSIFDEDTLTMYTLLLDNPNNPLIDDFKNSIDEFIDDLHESFDDIYGKISYEIYMYDGEQELLKSLFGLINKLKRDFLLIWNISFDIPFIVDRMMNIGMDPYEHICHKDFKNKISRFDKDTKNFKIANQTDCFKVSSYTKYLCQMRLYAATRKGQSELRSNSLNAVGKKELDEEKLDYSEEANIKTLVYRNYKKFVKYNIKDVLLQYGIERKVGDIDGLYLRSYSNATNYDKVFKQTVVLKNRAVYEFLLQGLVLGNNVNIYNQSEGKFKGAIVGDSKLNSHTGVIIFGIPSKYVYDNVIDMDFSSMYPHIIIAFNIERCTMIGKLIIPGIDEDTYDHLFINDEIMDNTSTSTEDDTDDDSDSIYGEEVDNKYDAGFDFMDNYLCGDYISMGHKWFGLPTFDIINERFMKEHHIKPTIVSRIATVAKRFKEKITILIK